MEELGKKLTNLGYEERFIFMEDGPKIREKCLEIASKLKSIDGGAMTYTELLATTEKLLNFINKQQQSHIDPSILLDYKD